MRFSERMGIKPTRTELQIDSMDDALRNSLWSIFDRSFLKPAGSEWISRTKLTVFFEQLWFVHFKLPLDTLNNHLPKTREKLRTWFFRWEWHEVYDFLEAVGGFQSPVDKEKFRSVCNRVFEQEMSGYRFVGDQIVPITNSEEIEEIEQALTNSTETGLIGVEKHLSSATAMLSDRKDPDYRNSIKESISAVESLCRVIAGKPSATLGEALKLIKDKVALHPALEMGFSSIYGYTSDEEGIRHAMTEQANCDFEDAKYMLVSCSAFINYLMMKAQKAGIGLSPDK